MENNPYAPPATLAPTAEHLEVTTLRRPVGVWLLTVWYLLLGGFLLVLLAFVLFYPESERPARRPISDNVIVAAGGLTIVVAWAMAIGLWRGARWSWWLVSFYNTFTAVGSVLVLPTAFFKIDEVQVAAQFIKNAGQAIISALVVAYLFRINVLHFYGLSLMKRRKALFWLIGSSLLVFGLILAITGYFFLRQKRVEQEQMQSHKHRGNSIALMRPPNLV